ncbi:MULTISPECIES: hypothetical protein [unclassified Curtobacterium]|uniref:hypothetical protein n=1 Tax=unclassified Curtobacterium TaxID=257496 RepID=UPI0008DE2869|nr:MULTISPECIES: hypothetical protein [unclassified Curtobacterium]OIH92243.1 hypothetical protein BIU92_11165 [Curtobacterium sp. MCBA15_003]OII10401.1 hypothetical protein BIU97_09650 [Curtobacterium sp. MCBA15_009]OII30222.1 hypothetical protein BIU94_11640 [Curtobacterium sp. MMLR14_006]
MHDDTPTEVDRPERRSPALIGLLVVVGLEFLALVVVTVVLVVELVVAPATSLASGIALTILAAVAALWLGALLNGLWQRRAWVRSGIIVWQVLQGAIAIGAFQGVFRVPAIGWLLLLPALLGITLVLSRSVTAALAHPAE